MSGIGESGHSPGRVSAFHPKAAIGLEFASDPKRTFRTQKSRLNERPLTAKSGQELCLAGNGKRYL